MTPPDILSVQYAPLPDEPPPQSQSGPFAWMRRNLFASWASTAITFTMLLVLAKVGSAVTEWAVLNAIWTLPGNTIADTQACRAPGVGACWALIAEKWRFILFGLYPYDQQWRPAGCIAVLVGLSIASTRRGWWNLRLASAWVLGTLVVAVLMYGGILGLPAVPEEQWGGLPVSLIISIFGIAFAFPLAIVTALGRRSDTNPVIRFLCTLYVEIIRGIPLISVLFMASVMFPLFLPEGVTISKLLRAQVGIILFVGAFLSEVIRGGLQGLDPGQSEAADSLGLNYWQKTFLVVLPQSLTSVLPAIVGLCIGFFKATSLVAIIGIFDLLSAAQLSVSDPAWQGFGTEAYLFAACIYFCFCFSFSRYGLSLERKLRRGR